MFKSLLDYIKSILEWPTEEGKSDNNAETSHYPKNDRIKYSYEQTDDFPESINNSIIYIVGENELEWLAVLRCPCGCNDVIQLNLLKESSPSWNFFRHKNERITISPSINRIVNCKSHFSILKGEVWWWGEWPYEEDIDYS